MSAPGENLRVNGDRLWDSLNEMAQIGPGVAGGNNRQTLTDEDGEGRALFQSWCEAAGCSIGVDQLGNMFARREGTDPDALPVYVGSHLDTHRPSPTSSKPSSHYLSLLPVQLSESASILTPIPGAFDWGH